VVEGRFYPSTKNKIFEQIKNMEAASRYPLGELWPERILGAVLPHAGHFYSGYQTIPFFQLMKRLRKYPDTFIIIHPNHSGFGLPVAIDDAEVWSNSIGDVSMDLELARAMELPFDRLAHAQEHSAEVIVPYLQYYYPANNFNILPVCMLDQSLKSASLVASRIGVATEETGRNAMIIASCDFSHFLPPLDGQVQDQRVLDSILSRNPEEVETAVREHHVSVCGYGPIMALMEYSISCYSEYKIEILARGHSGEVIASRDVVDYISMVMYQ